MTESNKVFGDLSENLLILCLVSQLKHILHKVISVGVLNQVLHLSNNEVGEVKLLISSAFLEASLHHTASMLMHSNFYTILHASIEDKLSVLGCDFTSLHISVLWTL